MDIADSIPREVVPWLFELCRGDTPRGSKRDGCEVSSYMNISVLVVDDEENIRWALQKTLSDNGYDIQLASTGEEALDKLSTSPDIMLLDFQLPDIDGIEILKRLKSIESPPLVIIMTAFGTIQRAVDTMHHGAYYFIQKPFKKEDLLLQLDRATEIVGLRITADERRRELAEASGFDAIIGESAAIEKAKEEAVSVASVPDTTVLILGDTGTGKEVFAKAIHLASDRADGNFEAINCASIPETLLESELFGYIPGAFTDAKRRKKGKIELASDGTLFLDEIGDMTPSLQAKILRALEEKTFTPLGSEKTIKVDVRIIAATNQDLVKNVREGLFREDLYYRLNKFPIQLPLLKEREDDVTLLAKHFINGLNEKFGRDIKSISPEAAYILRNYEWPGNVRELINVIERMMIIHRDITVVQPHHLPQDLIYKAHPELKPGEETVQAGYVFAPIPLDEVERRHILNVLEMTQNHKQKAAKILGISRKTLSRKLERWANVSPE